MFSSNLLGILFALTSAFVWGSGDFSGGLASRRASQFQVLLLSTLSGIVLLFGFALLWQETLPSLNSVFWAGLAGLAGALGISALYRGLAVGNAATVAPTAGVIGAALPVVFNILVDSWPHPSQLAGFILAVPGIWLVSRSDQAAGLFSSRGLGLAILAGIGFGGFFILIAQVETGLIFTPLIVSRAVSVGTALVLLWVSRTDLPSFTAHPVALLAGLLDAGGNIFYMLAQQFTRLDIAAVLSSLYPAATVLLARLILKESASPGQWLGACLCIAAVALIAL